MPSVTAKQFVLNYLLQLRGSIGQHHATVFQDENLNTRRMMDEIQNTVSFSELREKTTYLLQLLEEKFNSCFQSYSGVVANAIGYLRSHYSTKMTLEEVASFVNVHPNYLSRIFTQETGKNLVAYLNAFRVERAKVLLEDRSMSIPEVGEAVGFGNPKYFSSVFTKNCGMSPQKYRDMNKCSKKEC